MAGCTSRPAAVTAIQNGIPTTETKAKAYVEHGIMWADPNSPNYRKLIDSLNAIGIEVYDWDMIQMPRPLPERDQPSYT